MNPLDFALLTDENIHPDVIAFLRQQGIATSSIEVQPPFILVVKRSGQMVQIRIR
jgi:hypothetical protein